MGFTLIQSNFKVLFICVYPISKYVLQILTVFIFVTLPYNDWSSVKLNPVLFVFVRSKSHKLCPTYFPRASLEQIIFFQYHHMSLMDYVVSPSGCGRSVTEVWVWDAHEAQLRCSGELDGDIWTWSTRRGLKPKLY
jgi:hypothetical protein